MTIPSHRSALPAAAAVCALVGGGLAAARYHQLGLTLSHYDSRGHLVVARRIFDSITPGWQQIGAVWLPLPHLLNMLPVQLDGWYRSGASAVAISIVSFAIATGAIAWIVLTLTESTAAAAAAATFFAANPNVVYLQATPMTEPLQIALSAGSIALLLAWLRAPDPSSPGAPSVKLVGAAFAISVLTRYEAWAVAACGLAAAMIARWRGGETWRQAASRLGPIAAYPAGAIVAFMIFSRLVVGRWFVSSGFFVPENKALGRPLLAAAEIWYGAHMLSGYFTIAIASAGLLTWLVGGLFHRGRAERLVALSLVGAAALPWAAFANGHPFRIRYMVPLIAAEAVGVGAAVGSVKRLRAALAILAFAIAAYELRPLDAASPMVVEAQWETPNIPVRKHVTDCLRAGYNGETIMASMGSLGHYMQETSHDGFAVRDFLHEGNGDVWQAALDGPRPFAGWVMIEEKANGGDMLAKIARANPRFLDGFSRVCEGAGLALYRRTPKPEAPAGNHD